MATFSDLSFDVFVLILRNLEVRDLLHIKQCSKHFAFLVSSHPVWHAVLQQCISSGIPVVSLKTRISDLTTLDLVSVVARSIRLHRSWTSHRPIRLNTIQFTPTPSLTHSERKPLRLAFMNDEERRYALVGYLSAGLVEEADKHVVYCLDIGQPGANTVTTASVRAKMELPGIVQLVANSIATSDVAMFVAAHIDPDCEELAYKVHLLRLSDSEGLHVDQDTGLPVSGLAKQHCFTTKGMPYALNGSVLATADKRAWVWLYDVRTGSEIYELQGHTHEGNETARVVLLSDMVLVFGYESIRLFTLPEPLHTSGSNPLHFSTPRRARGTYEHTLQPTSIHSWRWGLDLLTVAPFQHPHAAPARPYINLFVRFRSYYPWPINMVHYYVLAPGSVDAPYADPPVLRFYTYSALDLFATSDAVLGPHGTVLWVDSHASQGAIGGQRVAGKLLRPTTDAEDGGGDGEVLIDAHPRDTHGAPYDRGTTMVFATLERAEVFKLALDEEAGRVAVGFTDGRVEVWEYLAGADT